MNAKNKQICWEFYKSLGKDAVKFDHWELDTETGGNIPAAVWKEFLAEPDVQDYISKEMQSMERVELMTLLDGIGKSRSVGQAQLVTALMKGFTDTAQQNHGPAYIYCYIPPNAAQAKAPNFVALKEDPFKKTVDTQITKPDLDLTPIIDQEAGEQPNGTEAISGAGCEQTGNTECPRKLQRTEDGQDPDNSDDTGEDELS